MRSGQKLPTLHPPPGAAAQGLCQSVASRVYFAGEGVAPNIDVLRGKLVETTTII
jgi:hypothetical protein